MTWTELVRTITNDLLVWVVSYAFLIEVLIDTRGGPRH